MKTYDVCVCVCVCVCFFKGRWMLWGSGYNGWGSCKTLCLHKLLKQHLNTCDPEGDKVSVWRSCPDLNFSLMWHAGTLSCGWCPLPDSLCIGHYHEDYGYPAYHEKFLLPPSLERYSKCFTNYVAIYFFYRCKCDKCS